MSDHIPDAGKKVENCQNCQKKYDFDKHASAWCKTCNKHYLCIECYDTHDCIPGKRRHMIIITNPQWICRLIEKQRKEDGESAQ